MQAHAHPPSRQDAVRAALQAMRATLTVAEALLSHGHVIDLAGLDSDVVYLCDAALALPRNEGATLADELALLLGQATELETRMRR